jgi:hypothetical protein
MMSKLNTLTRQEYKGKIYVRNIKKMHVGSESNVKVGSGFGSRSEKIIPNPQH